MKNIGTKITGVLIYLLIGYVALCFAAWNIDFREWHWLLRIILISLAYVPFNKQQFAKI